MATRQWLPAVSGTYDVNNPANWAFGVVPDAIDIAQFNVAGIETVTGNATLAEILASQGTISLAGTYTITGAQPTELSVTAGSGSPDFLTILAGALVDGNQAVSVSGSSALLTVQGGLVASSLSVTNSGELTVYQGSSLVVSGAISLNNGILLGRAGPGQSPGPAIVIGEAIQAAGADTLGSFGGQETDFNGVISGAGSLTISGEGLTELVVLNGANTYTGGTSIVSTNLTVAIGNASALGAGALTMTAGELLGTATETLTNSGFTLQGNSTVAAAHGTTLTINSSSINFNATSITIGAPGRDGVVSFLLSSSAAVNNPGADAVIIQAGTLKALDVTTAILLNDASTTIQAGAFLDLNGVSLGAPGLHGAGQVIDSGGAASLTLIGTGNFSGVISGPLALSLLNGTTVLSGANTYTGATTISSGATLTLGAGGASGSVASAITDSGTLAINRSDTFTLNNVSGAGTLTQSGSGTTILGSGLAYTGGTAISAGVLSVGAASALGAGGLTMTGGELLGTTTETIGNQLTLSGNFTIAAAHGQTLTMSDANGWGLGASVGEVISFGAAGQDGIVVFKDTPGGAAIGLPSTDTVTVQAGTLAAGDGGVAFLLSNDLATVVQSGATLDSAGFALAANALQGAGQVTDSGAAATLSLTGNGNFSGVISGPLAVTIASGATILTGANTYTGGTTIASGATLTLGAGAASGSVTGAIADNGTLAINRSDAFALNNVSGTGQLVQNGSGTTILGSGLTYSGGTVINAGVLSVGSASALGAGGLTIAGGELLASATETIANALTMSGNFTIAAAHGQTLTLPTTQPWHLTVSPAEVINFGAAGQDGVIVFNTAAGSSITTPAGAAYTVNVQAGTLQAGASGLGFLLGDDSATDIQAGATVDAAGIALQVNGLQGAGRLTDSGAAASLFLFNGDFAGLIDGAFAVTVFGAATLAGAETYTGGTTISSGAELTLGGAAGSVPGAIADNGTLEFHLSGSTVEGGVISGTGSLVQDGTGTTVLNVTNTYSGGTFLGGGDLELHQPGSAGSGSITFLNQTTSTLTIDGTSMPSNQILGFNGADAIDLSGVVGTGWTYSGSVFSLLNGSTPVALLNLSTPFAHPDFSVTSDGAGGTIVHLELQPADFTDNGFSGLIWQNTDGTPAIWEVNGTSVLSSQQLGSPGPTWRLVGSGDFNGDGNSDLAWQNSDGTAFIWEMNGSSIIGGGVVGNPGATWRLVGTGDFNGDGKSDLLWQNSNGAAFIWELNGTSIIAGGSPGNPGASWHLVGAGDFNGDGKSDILWQNSDGTPFIWEMNGTNIIGGGQLGNPGASWHLVGTGDFNGDGKSDLLWQNSDGTAAIWEMNGTSVLSSVQVGNPGPTWHLIGAGDFNGDGKSDILWQNSDGTPFIWEMNGTNIIGGGQLGDPGSAWHLIPGT